MSALFELAKAMCPEGGDLYVNDGDMCQVYDCAQVWIVKDPEPKWMLTFGVIDLSTGEHGKAQAMDVAEFLAAGWTKA